MTLVYKLVLRLICKEKTSQDLSGNQTHDHHNSSVTALPLSPWEQGDGGQVQVLLVPIWLIHQGSPKGILGMTFCHRENFSNIKTVPCG